MQQKLLSAKRLNRIHNQVLNCQNIKNFVRVLRNLVVINTYGVSVQNTVHLLELSFTLPSSTPFKGRQINSAYCTSTLHLLPKFTGTEEASNILRLSVFQCIVVSSSALTTSTTESFHKNSGYLDPKWLALYICYRLCDTENKAFPEKIGSNFRK